MSGRDNLCIQSPGQGGEERRRWRREGRGQRDGVRDGLRQRKGDTEGRRAGKLTGGRKIHEDVKQNRKDTARIGRGQKGDGGASGRDPGGDHTPCHSSPGETERARQKEGESFHLLL